MKRLKDNLFAIDVPLWSTQHEVYNTSIHTVVKYPAPWGWGRISILKEEYKIIGTITADTIDFDPAPFLSLRVDENLPNYPEYRVHDYFGPFPKYTEDPIEAFRSIFYFYYLPDNLPIDFDDWPEERVIIKDKILLLQMVNFTSENW